MRLTRAAVLIGAGLICCAAPLFGESPADSADQKRAQVRQCRAWLRSAIDNREQGRVAEALADLDSVLLCDAKNPDAYFLRSQLLVQKGDTAGAVAALRTGVAEAPLSARIKLYLARLLVARGEFDEAVTLVDAVLVIKPREGEALYLKGLLDLQSGSGEAALDYFEAALTYGLESHAR